MLSRTPVQAFVLNRANQRPLPLTDTFPQWIPSPSSQSCFKGLLDSALLPAVSVCEGQNQLKTRSQSKIEQGMCCCLRHPQVKPCVGSCCISWGLSLWLSLPQTKSFLGAHSSQALALLDEQLLMDLICAFGAAQQHKC